MSTSDKAATKANFRGQPCMGGVGLGGILLPGGSGPAAKVQQPQRTQLK